MPTAEDNKRQRKLAEKEIRKRRFNNLTEIDKQYLKEFDFSSQPDFHDPVKWFLRRYIYNRDDTSADPGKKKIFLAAYSDILKQNHYGHLTKADTLWLEHIGSQDTDLSQLDLSEQLRPEEQIFKLFSKALGGIPHSRDSTQLRSSIVDDFIIQSEKLIAALEQSFEISAQRRFTTKSSKRSAPIPEIYRHYMDYLRSVLGKFKDSREQSTLDEFARSFNSEFIESLITPLPLEAHSQSHKSLQQKLTVHSQHVSEDITSILNAYIGKESSELEGLSLFSREHSYKGAIKSEEGKCFAKLVHHIALISGKPQLKMLGDSVSKSLPEVIESIYGIFHDIQKNYIEKLRRTYQIGLREIGKDIQEDHWKIFISYANAVLYTPSEVARYYSQLIKLGYSRKTLKSCEHSLLCELKPMLDKETGSVQREIRLLKKDINRFIQSTGRASRISKKDNFDFQRCETLYDIKPQQDTQLLVVGSAKQQSQLLKHWSTAWGTRMATSVGLGEGLIVGIALASSIAALSFGLPPVVAIGTLIFIAGFLLNRFLLLRSCSDLLKSVRLNLFSKDNQGLPLPWYKKLLNYALAALTFFGLGVVSAAMFSTESFKIVQGLAAAFHGALHIASMILGGIFIVPIAVAELIGMTSLAHMANNGLLKKTLSEMVASIKNLFYQRFYVALPQNWDSAAHVAENLLEIVKNIPRLLVSTIFIASSLAIMAYYLKMTFGLFAGMVASLLVMIPIIKIAAAVVGVVSQSVSGTSIFVTFMTFTLPLGKLFLSLFDNLLKIPLAIMAFSMAAVVATMLLPYRYVTREDRNENFLRVVKNTYCEFFEKFYTKYQQLHAWLTSASIHVPGGLSNAVASALKKEASSAREESTTVNSGALAKHKKLPCERVVRDEERASFIKQKIVYPLCLLLNSLGQAFLFLPYGLRSFHSPVDMFSAGLFGTRSFAMNSNAAYALTSAEIGSNRMVQQPALTCG